MRDKGILDRESKCERNLQTQTDTGMKALPSHLESVRENWYCQFLLLAAHDDGKDAESVILEQYGVSGNSVRARAKCQPHC